MGARAGSEAAMVPPLECVLETEWAGVEVDWNGSDEFDVSVLGVDVVDVVVGKAVGVCENRRP